MQVSVVIPVRNRAALATLAIESVLGQSYPPLDVVVVDDASTDGTADRLAARFGDRITLVRLPTHAGRSAARNVGMQTARGTLIAFLDSDDLWLPDKLARQVPAFADPSVGLVHCRVALIDAAGRPLPEASAVIATSFAEAERRGYGYGEITETWCRMYTPAVVVRREIVEQVGMFDESLSQFEDWDFFWRIARHAAVRTIPEVLALVREHDGNAPASWAEDATPWMLVNSRHIAALDGVPDTASVRRARFNLLINLALGAYWSGDLRASRRHLWRALRGFPRPWRRPRLSIWGLPLLAALLPRGLATFCAARAGFDTYTTKRRPSSVRGSS